MMNRLKTAMLSASALVLLSACGDGAQEDQAGNQQEQMEPTNPETGGDADTDTAETITDTSGGGQEDSQGRGIQNQEFAVSLTQAIDILYDTFGEVEIEEIQFDEEDGRYAYDFDAQDSDNEYDLVVDAETGDILDQEQESETDDNDDVIDVEGIISPQEAMDIALQTASEGAYVTEWELTEEDGRTVYELDLEDDSEDVVVDAHSGEVLER